MNDKDHERAEAAYVATVEDQWVAAREAKWAPVIEQAAKALCNCDLADQRAWDLEGEVRRDLWRSKATRLRDAGLLADPDVAGACRIAVAEELRAHAELTRTSVLLDGPLGQAVAGSTRSIRERLLARANQLDPEGAR
jgi:hypothetical protein